MRIPPGVRFNRGPVRVCRYSTLQQGDLAQTLPSLWSEKEMSPVKFEIPFLAALVVIGTSLSARVAGQGVEQALLSTVIAYSLNERMRKVVSALVGRLCLIVQK